MNKFEKLLSLEKDINILEQFGNYKSAKVLHKKFMRVAQQSIESLSEDEAIKSVDDSSSVSTEKSSGDQPSSGTLQNGSSDSYTSIWLNIFRIAYNENISLPDALNKFAGTGVKFNGKTLASHINYPKLKAKFPQIMPSKEINKNSRQYSFMILYALTDYVLDNQLFQYLNPPEGYEFPANMAGKPLNLNIYERIGLFRSTYPQERMFIFQKIKQLDPNSGFQGNGILPRIQ
jgi:hypothetical protein